MNTGYFLLALTVVAAGAFHAGTYVGKREVHDACSALGMFATAERVYLCEDRAKLAAERKKTEDLERKGSP